MGRMGADYQFQDPMISAAETGGIGERGPGGVDRKQAKLSRGKEKADPDFGGQTADQDFRQGVHGSGNSKE